MPYTLYLVPCSSKRIDKSLEPKSVRPDSDATVRVGEARIAVWFLTEDKQETTNI